MGMPPFNKSCFTNMQSQAPDPKNFKILGVNATVGYYMLVVQYPGCTNYEGIKCMLYKGEYNNKLNIRDPHFSKSIDSPIARFTPDEYGVTMCHELMMMLSRNKGKIN